MQNNYNNTITIYISFSQQNEEQEKRDISKWVYCFLVWFIEILDVYPTNTMIEIEMKNYVCI